MEISLTARHCKLPKNFKEAVENKMNKVATIGRRLDRVDVCVDHQNNPRLASSSEIVELTARDGKILVRAEAAASDVYSALDLAQEKLVERLRRARDRQKGRSAPGMTDLNDLERLPLQSDALAVDDDDLPQSPIAVRHKTHVAAPMTLDEALSAMELVGHDFYLFIDKESGLPSVVYRRKGWSYGVIGLQTEEATMEQTTADLSA